MPPYDSPFFIPNAQVRTLPLVLPREMRRMELESTIERQTPMDLEERKLFDDFPEDLSIEFGLK